MDIRKPTTASNVHSIVSEVNKKWKSFVRLSNVYLEEIDSDYMLKDAGFLDTLAVMGPTIYTIYKIEEEKL